MANENQQRIDAAVNYLQENFSQRLPLDKIARQFFISPFHFHRLFKAATGVTIANFVQAQRIARARYLLRHSRKSINDIALACGWKNQATMTRAFGRDLQRTPSQVRRNKISQRDAQTTEQGQLPKLSVRLEYWPELHALALGAGNVKKSLPARWRSLIDAGLSAGLFGQVTPRVFAYYPLASSLRNQSYSLAIEGSAQPPFLSLRFPAGKHLVGEYTGSARYLGTLYDRLYQRVLRHDLNLAPRAAFEVFLQYSPFVPEDKSRILMAVPLEK